MPELPEVEGVRRTLEPYILGLRITAVQVWRKDFVTPEKAPLRRLAGHTFQSSFRHGKKLFLVIDDGQTLLIHLGMSGRVDCVPADSERPVHTHVAFTLSSGTQVRLRDPRRFGGLWYYPTLQAAKADALKNLGPDALTATTQDLAPWRATPGRLKQRLLSQQDIAGLGNIYVDEALWLAQLHPLQRVSRITPAQLEGLIEAVHTVLNRSILAGGTTLRDYRNVAGQPGEFARQLLVYGRGGEPCARCSTTLRTKLVAGRTTVFCPVCQTRR